MNQQRLDRAFQDITDSKKIPGAAGIVLDRSGKTLFKGAYGVTNLTDETKAKPVTASTPVMMFSCTKLVTSICALQLIEQGKLKLDDLVETYVPEIKVLKVLDGFDTDGSPMLREQKTKATVLMLLTHTAGFSYDIFSPDTLKYHQYVNLQPHGYNTGAREYFFDTPLLFDPGSRFSYGTSTDWVGFVVEAVSGMKLNEYVEKNILSVLGMKHSGAHWKGGCGLFAEDGLLIHHRGEDGTLTANPALGPEESPAVFGGGGYMHSTLDDYATLLLTILNDGTEPKSGVQILRGETVREYLFTDQIPKVCSSDGVGVISTASPMLAIEAEFLPGLKKGWSCGLLLNPEGRLKGRSAGSGGWSGLSNVYYFIDPKEGKLALLMCAILPFMDTEVLHLFDELERAAYDFPPANGIGEIGCNYLVKKKL